MLEPLPLNFSWPLREAAGHFELGRILNCLATDALEPNPGGELGAYDAGLWECDLADSSLVWSGGVYDIFGLPRGVRVTRDEALALYSDASRAAMERLRSHAIEHRQGFTIDVEIRPVGRRSRWVRLVAAPDCESDRPRKLHGLKLAI